MQTLRMSLFTCALALLPACAPTSWSTGVGLKHNSGVTVSASWQHHRLRAWVDGQRGVSYSYEWPFMFGDRKQWNYRVGPGIQSRDNRLKTNAFVCAHQSLGHSKSGGSMRFSHLSCPGDDAGLNWVEYEHDLERRRDVNVASPCGGSCNRDPVPTQNYDLPPIYVTTVDYGRLAAAMETLRVPPDDGLLAFLERELTRARIVEPTEIAPYVVTMNSQVQYRDDATGEVWTITLVYPGGENEPTAKVSVFSPVGGALLGMPEGETIGLRASAGVPRRLTVLKVLYQPEANGLDLSA